MTRTVCGVPRLALALALVLVMSTPAHAAPVHLDFESGATVGQTVTNQYGAPSIPAGPSFKAGQDAGFGGMNCGPPTLSNSYAAHSGSNALLLSGCPAAEFWATAGFFALGYSTDAVSFWATVNTGTGATTHIIATAFDASRGVVQQVDTPLPMQASPTYVQISLSSSTSNIAFVAIEYGTQTGNLNSPTGVTLSTGNSYLLVDDLTYDPPSSPPASSFLLGANPAKTSTDQGGQVDVTIPVTWTNNPDPSSSPVSLEVKTPTGVTGSFFPNPTSTGSSVLTLHVATTAPIGPGLVVVDGYVDKGQPSEKHDSVNIPFGVSPAFEVVDPGTVRLAPCTPKEVTLTVQTADNFTQPLTIGVYTGVVDITGISGGSVFGPGEATTKVTPHNGVATATLDLAVASDVPPHPNGVFNVSASSTGYSNSNNHNGRLDAEQGWVDGAFAPDSVFSLSNVFTPAFGGLGTDVTLTGGGFCPGSTVAIGDDHNVSVPESISSDGTSLTFRVPRGAVTGPIHVVGPDGRGFVGPALTVHSFRNTYGFSWPNKDYGMRLNGDMVDELFGKQQTNINFFGWLIRKPEASLYEASVNKVIPKGICFGMAYSSFDLFDHPSEQGAFPHVGGNDTWHLDDAYLSKSPLLRYVIERFGLQFSDELIPIGLNSELGIHGTNDDINAIKAGLATGEPVLVSLIKWNGVSVGGHTVLAYDTHPLPDGSTAVDVVNSNEPYQTTEESNADTHDRREFTNSQIIIKDGNWTFPELNWSGSEADMVVYNHSDLPLINGKQPHLPNLFTATVLVVFGSGGDGVTQVSGSSGGALFKNGQLAPQGSWPKGVAPMPAYSGQPGPLQVVAENPKTGAPINATVDRARGGGAMSVNLPGLQAQLQSGAQRGQTDHVVVDPHADSIDYRSNRAGTPLAGTLVAAPGAHASAASGLSDHVAAFKTSVGRGGDDRFSFPHGRELVVQHTGPTSDLTLTLSSFGPDGRPLAIVLPKVRLSSGETLRAAPGDWRRLSGSAVRLTTVVRGHKASRVLHGRELGGRFARVKKAGLTALAAETYRADLTVALRHAPAQGWVAVQAELLKGRRSVAKAKPTQVSMAALRSGRMALPLIGKVTPGRYVLRLKLLETTARGPTQAGVEVPQTLAVTARP